MRIGRLKDHFDQLLALALAVLFVVEVFTEKGFRDQRPLSLATALPFCAALAWRRRLPVLPKSPAAGPPTSDRSSRPAGT